MLSSVVTGRVAGGALTFGDGKVRLAPVRTDQKLYNGDDGDNGV